MKIVKQEVTNKKNNSYFVYKYSNGKFASKELYEKQEAMSNNKKKRVKKVVQPAIQEESLNPDFVETINKIEDNLNQEWVGETGVFVDQIEEDKPSVDFDAEYKKKVDEFEQKTFDKSVIDLSIGEDKLPDNHQLPQDKIEEPKKGFFTSWLKKWIW